MWFREYLEDIQKLLSHIEIKCLLKYQFEKIIQFIFNLWFSIRCYDSKTIPAIYKEA